MLWDVSQDKPLFQKRVMNVRLTDVVVDPEFRRLDAGGCSEETLLEGERWQVAGWSLGSGQQLSSVDGFARAFEQLAVSPDGHRVAIIVCSQRIQGVCGNPELRLLSMPDQKLAASPLGPRERVTEMRFSPDGALLLVSGCDTVNFDRTCASPVVRVFSADNGSERVSIRPAGLVSASAFTADGRYLLTGAGEGTVELWNLSIRKAERVFNGGRSAVTSVAVSPDGSRLVWGTFDSTLRVWVPGIEKEPRKLELRKGAITAVAVSGNSRWLATGSADRMIRLFDLEPSGR